MGAGFRRVHVPLVFSTLAAELGIIYLGVSHRQQHERGDAEKCSRWRSPVALVTGDDGGGGGSIVEMKSQAPPPQHTHTHACTHTHTVFP